MPHKPQTNIQFEKDNHLLFFNTSENLPGNQNPKDRILEELRVSFQTFNYKNVIEAYEVPEMLMKQVKNIKRRN